jgi:hypothetical protein
LSVDGSGCIDGADFSKGEDQVLNEVASTGIAR